MKLTIANTGIHQDAEGRFSLNDLHRASGGEERHLPKFFLANQQTQDLITEISTSTDGGIPPSPLSVKRGGNNQGSYGAKELVYAYAMWISPKFHLQVIRTFDAVATGDSGKAERIAKVGAGNTALDKLRTANALKLAEETAARICSRFANLGDSAQQLIYAKIINPIVGDEVLMLPAVQEQHFTAAEVGERFNCGNLLPVAHALRAKFPRLQFVVCADNDAATPGNPGVSAALTAARAIGARVAVPRFTETMHG